MLKPSPPPPRTFEALVWDSITQKCLIQSNAYTGQVTFNVTNVSVSEATIRSLRSSCGCTVAEMPSTLWCLAPGTGGPIHVVIDVRGKRGTLSKFVAVDTSVGAKMLNLKVAIPYGAGAMAMILDERRKNQSQAKVDR